MMCPLMVRVSRYVAWINRKNSNQKRSNLKPIFCWRKKIWRPWISWSRASHHHANAMEIWRMSDWCDDVILTATDSNRNAFIQGFPFKRSFPICQGENIYVQVHSMMSTTNVYEYDLLPLSSSPMNEPEKNDKFGVNRQPIGRKAKAFSSFVVRLSTVFYSLHTHYQNFLSKSYNCSSKIESMNHLNSHIIINFRFDRFSQLSKLLTHSRAP